MISDNYRPGRVPFGATINFGMDSDDRERRIQLICIVRCPQCSSTIELFRETEEWYKDACGNWIHQSFGPAVGICRDCRISFIDYWKGTFAFRPDEYE